ncbi:MAG: protein-L-isoaspartate O-methyltransferase [Alphaproteobacteria bacterium]
MNDLSGERRLSMVNGQIRPNSMTDERVVAAMLAVPRELFVPKALRGVAYVDEDIPVGGDRYLMEPRVLARLLQAADIEPDNVVLDVGCTTGYSTAVLARLAGSVVAIESDAELGARAQALIAELSIDNAAVVIEPLADGYAEQAPYDVIVLGGAVDVVPAVLSEQLAEGGRMVLVKRARGVGTAWLYRRDDGMVSGRELFDAQVMPLPGFERPTGFVF